MTTKKKIQFLTNAIYLLSMGCDNYVKEEIEKTFYADKDGVVRIKPSKKK